MNRMVESVKYSVVRPLDRAEIRRYPRMMLATVRGMSDDDAFGILFQYISGRNSSNSRINMTVPVVSGRRGERIPMTAPVFSGGGSFSFVLPAVFDRGSAPIPADERVELGEIPDRLLAVLRFRGSGSDKQVIEKTEELMADLRAHGLKVSGEPFLMRYNPPFIPGIFRRNEVAVPIEGA